MSGIFILTACVLVPAGAYAGLMAAQAATYYIGCAFLRRETNKALHQSPSA